MFKPIMACLGFGLLVAGTASKADDKVSFAPVAPHIDGEIDQAWDSAQWHYLDQHILGEVPEPDDFSGQYKLLWDKGHLYVLAEITDDVLHDGHVDPKVRYWDDDCLEIFIDPDASGGNHLNNHNAFAYHVALDGNVADIGRKKQDGSNEVLLLNDHVRTKWSKKEGTQSTYVWEAAVRLYPETFDPQGTDNAPLLLGPGKTIGFMLAYCDNDGSPEREHFMGSHAITPVDGDKNLGYITASVFGKIKLSQ